MAKIVSLLLKALAVNNKFLDFLGSGTIGYDNRSSGKIEFASGQSCHGAELLEK
jgi:hypothetical protein